MSSHHEVSYGDSSGAHEMTVAFLNIQRSAQTWERLGLGLAHNIQQRSLMVLQQAQGLPAHRRPPQPIFITALYLKIMRLHPQGQLRWLQMLADHEIPAYTVTLRSVRLRGFSAGSYAAATVAILLATHPDTWKIQVAIGAYAGPAYMLTALFTFAAMRRVYTRVSHLQADSLCLWGSSDISSFQLPPYFTVSYLTGWPRWMRSPYHEYAHLLEVNLRGGLFDVHQLLLEYADIMPFKRRLGTPLRLITWMRMQTNHFDVTARSVVTALKPPSPMMLSPLPSGFFRLC